MKVSFVIPVHNESGLINKCIDHIRRNKDFNDHEIIVVVSSTTNDETETKLCDNSVRWIRSKATSRAIQMNEGASNANGEIICFVHADVLISFHSINCILKSVHEGYQAGYFSYEFDHQNPLLKINSRLTRRDGLFTGGGDQSLFILKSVFESLNGFDDTCVLMEDFEFFDRLKMKNVRYTIINEDALVSARKYNNNSYLKVNLVNGIIFSMYKLGTPTPVLKKWYGKLLK